MLSKDEDSFPTNLIEVHPNATVEDAFKLLSKYQVHSLPVVNDMSDGQRKYLGVLEEDHLLRFAMLEPAFLLSKGLKAEINVEDRTQMVSLMASFLQKSVGDVLRFANEKLAASSKLVLCSIDDPLATLIDHFAKGVHRALIAKPSPNGELELQLVSQADVVRFLKAHLHALPQTLLSICASDVAAAQPVAVRSTVRALDALLVMHSRHVSACAITDDSGRLQGTVSAADLRGLNSSNIHSINYPVAFFQHTLAGHVHEASMCSADDTLQVIIERVAQEHHHGMWVIDHFMRPVGVITLTDIIKVFSPLASF